VEEKHLQQMKDFIDTYIKSWNNQYALLGQVILLFFFMLPLMWKIWKWFIYLHVAAVAGLVCKLYKVMHTKLKD